MLEYRLVSMTKQNPKTSAFPSGFDLTGSDWKWSSPVWRPVFTAWLGMSALGSTGSGLGARACPGGSLCFRAV